MPSKDCFLSCKVKFSSCITSIGILNGLELMSKEYPWIDSIPIFKETLFDRLILIIQSFWCSVSEGSGTWNRIFGHLESAKKWVYRQIEQGFSSFFANFVNDISMFHSVFGVLHFEQSSKMAKISQKMKIILVQLAFNLCIPQGYFQNPKPNFWVPGSSLITVEHGCTIPKFFFVPFQSNM